MKKVAGLSVDDLVHITKLIFAEFGLPNKIISDAGMNFMSDILQKFCRKMNIQLSITSSYHNKGQWSVRSMH